MSFRLHFWSMVNDRGTHRARVFFISNFSYRILCTAPTEIPTISGISRTFILRSSMKMRWIFSIISGTVTSTGRPGRASSFVDVRPRLKSLIQIFWLFVDKLFWIKIFYHCTEILCFHYYESTSFGWKLVRHRLTSVSFRPYTTQSIMAPSLGNLPYLLNDPRTSISISINFYAIFGGYTLKCHLLNAYALPSFRLNMDNFLSTWFYLRKNPNGLISQPNITLE